jgi:hypothetical protein
LQEVNIVVIIEKRRLPFITSVIKRGKARFHEIAYCFCFKTKAELYLYFTRGTASSRATGSPNLQL